jgi:tetratricopeptide (TPR) repeat protein
MRLIPILLMALLLLGCASPTKLVKNQQYDQAVEKLSKSLRTGTPKEKHINLLSQAYHAANQRDHDRIMLLRQSGQPDIWSDIYYSYLAMNRRQELIKGLPETVKQGISFRPIDYGADISESRNKASAYLYARAEQLLKSNDRADARKAYDLLMELTQINRNYRDIEMLLRQALLQGTNQVLLAFDNQTGLPLPEGFTDKLMAFNPAQLRDEFVQYDLYAVDGKTYDFTVWVTLKSIHVSPEQVESRSFTETKEIKDGTKPKRDEEGNIVLDEDGQVVEVANYTTVSAIVNETLLNKSALLEGSVDYMRNSDNSILFTIPISANNNFSYAFATVNGDLKAISKETMQLMQNMPIPFPPDGLMVLEAAKALNESALRSINRESSRMNSYE